MSLDICPTGLVAVYSSWQWAVDGILLLLCKTLAVRTRAYLQWNHITCGLSYNQPRTVRTIASGFQQNSILPPFTAALIWGSSVMRFGVFHMLRNGTNTFDDIFSHHFGLIVYWNAKAYFSKSFCIATRNLQSFFTGDFEEFLWLYQNF